MRQKFFLLCAFSILGISSSFARLGETEAECEKRYGKGKICECVPDGMSYLAYEKAPFHIDIFFLNGRACKIRYGIASVSRYAQNEGLSEKRIRILLEKNANQSPWEQKNPEVNESWLGLFSRSPISSNFSHLEQAKDGKMMVAGLDYWQTKDGKLKACVSRDSSSDGSEDYAGVASQRIGYCLIIADMDALQRNADAEKAKEEKEKETE